MGAYIIHFDDKPWQDLDDERYYRCKEIPWFSTTKTTISSLTPYTEPDMEQVGKEAYDNGYETAKNECEDCLKQAHTDALRMDAYQKGLSDAWETARKVVALSTVDRRKVFGSEYMYSILEKHTASEAIEKIQAYEQEKEEIKVGDEVEAVSGKAVIIEVLGNGKDVRYMYPDASTGFNDSCNVTRTGRHFHQIAEVLQKMKEA